MSQFIRTRLAEQLVVTLAEDIAAGVWERKLPGYRSLAKRYGVSRPTCEDAVAILERNGLVEPPERGRGRRIRHVAATTPLPSMARQLLVIVDRLHPPPPADEDLLTRIAEFWRSSGGAIHRVTGDMVRSRHPQSQMTRWIQQTAADCLLLHTPPAPWVHAANDCGLPNYSLGGDIGGASGRISYSFHSVIGFVKARLKEAIDIGHRRILVAIGGPVDHERIKELIEASLSPMLLEHRRQSEGPPLDVAIGFPDAAGPEACYRWWPRILTDKQPTLVILVGVFEAVSLHEYCHRTGIRMPRDLSMVVMSDTPILEWLNPAPTRYRYPTDKALEHFRRWVEMGFPEGHKLALTGELIGGSTFGPPPGIKK